MRSKSKCFILTLSVIVAASFTTLFSGCDMIPREEIQDVLPTLERFEHPSYLYSTCVRTDLYNTRVIRVVLSPARNENLSFSIENEPYDTIYVSVGDYVNEGDLLAQLDIRDFQKSYDEGVQSLASLEQQRADLDSDLAISKTRLSILYTDPQVYQSEYKSLIRSYEYSKKELEDRIAIQTMRNEDLLIKIREHQIYAPFSGIVNYVYFIQIGDLSNPSRNIVGLSDNSSLCFLGASEYYKYLVSNEVYDVEIDDEIYSMKYISEPDLGYEYTNSERQNVRMFPTDETVSFEEGTVGYASVCLEEALDTLAVPIKAVTYINEQPYVYVSNEDGVRVAKPIKVGITTIEYVEVLDGLEENDQVILSERANYD